MKLHDCVTIAPDARVTVVGQFSDNPILGLEVVVIARVPTNLFKLVNVRLLLPPIPPELKFAGDVAVKPKSLAFPTLTVMKVECCAEPGEAAPCVCTLYTLAEEELKAHVPVAVPLVVRVMGVF